LVASCVALDGNELARLGRHRLRHLGRGFSPTFRKTAGVSSATVMAGGAIDLG
jgi:hypothetical protein